MNLNIINYERMSPASEATVHGMTTMALQPPSPGGFSWLLSCTSSSLLTHAPSPQGLALLLRQTSGWPQNQTRLLLPERIPYISPPLSSLSALCMDETSDLFSLLGHPGLAKGRERRIETEQVAKPNPSSAHMASVQNRVMAKILAIWTNRESEQVWGWRVRPGREISQSHKRPQSCLLSRLPGLTLSSMAATSHTGAFEHLQCGQSELRAGSITHTPDFKDLVWNKNTKYLNISLRGEIIIF